jgi:orotidine-5'-phosphate decarboxylase
MAQLLDRQVNERAAPLRNPLCVALDVDTREQALSLAEDLADIAGGFKLGPRLVNKYGEKIVQEISQMAPVFVDCKFFDIPSTMEAAVRAAFNSGASLVTVHAMSGAEALKKLALLEAELNKQRAFKILAVTILTSWNQESLPPVMTKNPISEHVRNLAELVQSSGLSSVVCSPEEISLLRDLKLYLVTPGIRFETDAKDDQKRVLGPVEALQRGSSALVVGRPIIAAKNPKAAAMEFMTSIYV